LTTDEPKICLNVAVTQDILWYIPNKILKNTLPREHSFHVFICTDVSTPSELGRSLRCEVGYELPQGLVEAMVWCEGGQWVYPKVLYPHQGGRGDSPDSGIYSRLSKWVFYESLFWNFL